MKYTLGFLLLLLAAQSLCGQSGPFANPAVERISLDEGLPHRSNYSAAYDRDSVLWLSTEGGVCRNDRYRVSGFSQFEQVFKGILRRNEGNLLYVSPESARSRVQCTGTTNPCILPRALLFIAITSVRGRWLSMSWVRK